MDDETVSVRGHCRGIQYRSPKAISANIPLAYRDIQAAAVGRTAQNVEHPLFKITVKLANRIFLCATVGIRMISSSKNVMGIKVATKNYKSRLNKGKLRIFPGQRRAPTAEYKY